MADLLALLTEVSSDNPCGDYLEYDAAYLELGKNILGKPEDPITGEAAQPPNWREIHKQCLSILQQSKDIQVAVYLVRALIHLEGLAGFRDGLHLLNELLQKFWPHIHPVLDPDDDLDPTARVNILEELNHFDSVLKPLSQAYLVESKSVGRFCLRDIQWATGKEEPPAGTAKPDLSLIQAAFHEVAAEVNASNYQAIQDSLACLQALEAFVAEQVGIQNGPDLSALSTLLKEIRYAFEHYAQTADAAEAEGADEAGEAEGDADSGVVVSRKQAGVAGIHSRQDVLKTLDLIMKYYAENEPSSPVPILLQRAQRLVTADFMQIVQNLLPDGLSQLKQIKGPDPDADQY